MRARARAMSYGGVFHSLLGVWFVLAGVPRWFPLHGMTYGEQVLAGVAFIVLGGVQLSLAEALKGIADDLGPKP